MGTGNDNNSWGSNANTLVFQIIEDAIANALTSAVTGGTLDLSGTPPPAAASQVRYAALIFSGALGSAQVLQVPNLTKFWWVKNATSGAYTLKFKTPSGSASTAIPQNSGWQLVYCDGANNIVVDPYNTVQTQMPDGSAAAPPYSFLNDTASGWYRAGTQDYRLSINGTDVLQVTGTGASSPSVVNALSPNLLKQQGSTVPTISGSPTTGHLTKWASATQMADAGLAAVALDSSATGMNQPLNLSLSVTHTGGNLLQLAVKNLAGSDPSATSPVNINFPTVSGSNTTGAVTTATIAAALSMTSNSTSATLGTANSTPFRIWFALFNNGGTPVLAMQVCAKSNGTQIFAIGEYGVASTTGISSSATSPGVWYTPNGTSLSNCAYRLIGWCEYVSGLATAGSFTANPDNVGLFTPGMNKPGDMVQGINGGSSAVLTLTSACNYVRVSGQTLDTINVSAGANVYGSNVSLRRTISGVHTNIQTIPVNFYIAGGFTTMGTLAALGAYDFPATSLAVTYDFTVSAGNAGSSNIVAEEIMV